MGDKCHIPLINCWNVCIYHNTVFPACLALSIFIYLGECFMYMTVKNSCLVSHIYRSMTSSSQCKWHIIRKVIFVFRIGSYICEKRFVAVSTKIWSGVKCLKFWNNKIIFKPGQSVFFLLLKFFESYILRFNGTAKLLLLSVYCSDAMFTVKKYCFNF